MKKEHSLPKEDNLKVLEQKIDELTSGWQRTQADFINYKKQVNDERVKLYQTANANLIYELLPILDNFSLAAKHTPEELQKNAWTQGIKQIEKQLENTLFNMGLEKIEAEDQIFNPSLHEAIDEVESDKPEGIIVEEVTAGYKLNNEVLRPSRVKVSKGK